MKTNDRNSSIELLRIVAMFMIVISHSSIHGLSNSSSDLIINNIFKDILTLGNLGVAIFVIITGYVSTGKDIKIKKIISLEFQVLFYSIIFYVISTIINHSNILSSELLKSFFPILFKKYWFMSAYMILYLFIPFINEFISNIDSKKFYKFILLNVFLVFLIPTITTCDLYFNELFQIFTFYFIGAYLRINNVKSDINEKKLNFLMISLIVFLICSSCLIEVLSLKIPLLTKYSTYFFNRNSILILVLATCIFLKFINISKFNNKIVNTIASATLGIYLIHDNPNFRIILWNKIFYLPNYINEPYFILLLILTSIIVFTVCCLMELLRKKVFDRFIDKISTKIDYKITERSGTK